jgi:hypothetical protein
MALTTSNVELFNAIRNSASPAFQARIPDATRGSLSATIESMWSWTPGRNEFIDSLINVIGLALYHKASFDNPLGKFKKGRLEYGDTVEEIAVGLLNAYVYNPDREYLEADIFGREPNEVQSRFHKVNRRNVYKLTVNELLLKQAFNSEGGVSRFVATLMSTPQTSDNWDEFLLMSSLFRQYYDNGGFFKVNIADLSSAATTQAQVQDALVQQRVMAETLPFVSRRFNAARMPVTAQRDDLEWFTTPEADARTSVVGLAAAFNVSEAEFSSRKTIIPSEYFNIPGVQGILSTKDLFVVLDQLTEMRQSQNPVGLHQNFFLHRWQTISISPFVPAILFTSSEASTPIVVNDSPVSSVSALVVKDKDNATVTNVKRGENYTVIGSAITNPTGGTNDGVIFTLEGAQSPRTWIAQTGVLHVGPDETADELLVRARATGNKTKFSTENLNVTGDRLVVTIGATIDSTDNDTDTTGDGKGD